MIEIKQVFDNKKRFLDLLLLGDEQETMIDLYLEDGDLYALYDEVLISTCVVIHIDNFTCELKNIAVYPLYQGKDYGQQFVKHIFSLYKDSYKNIIVGTGKTPSTLRFYRSCGFEYSHTINGFFLNHYNHPIIEEGVLLDDMIYLKKEL